MSQINPKEIIEKGILVPCEFTEIQQVGIDLSTSEGLQVPHGSSINITFHERINLNDEDIYATIHQRSSYSRKGIFMTSGVYDPGYRGSLGCTIYNMSGELLEIPANTRIAQLVCFEANPASKYMGQWQDK